MLSLTRRTEYGLIALAYLTRNREKICSAREISETHHVPLPLLMNIMKSFQQNHLITSTRGARGGYQLSREPHKISIQRVIEVLEGPMHLVQCACLSGGNGNGNHSCEIDGRCLLRPPLLKLHKYVTELMASVTLADLVDGDLSSSRLSRYAGHESSDLS